ncbi:MAG: IS1595 family transposase [Bryobacterales bacterium]|nr:IS1595 family transposase [Bryobacterales bacterium]
MVEPTTLQEAILFFSNPENCHDYMVARRWPNGVVTCPSCGSDRVSYLSNQKKWQCSTKHSKRQFTLKTGTIFEDSPLGLDKWLTATWMITNCRNGISSWELHRTLGITQKAAWFVLHRVRLAMQDDLTGGNLEGEVEVDETFIGGKARNMHKDRKRRVQAEGRNTGGKTVVLGILERKTKRVRATVVPNRKKDTMQSGIRGVVEPGASIHSDEHGNSWKMEEYEHLIVNHLEAYVSGNVHT